MRMLDGWILNLQFARNKRTQRGNNDRQSSRHDYVAAALVVFGQQRGGSVTEGEDSPLPDSASAHSDNPWRGRLAILGMGPQPVKREEQMGVSANVAFCVLLRWSLDCHDAGTFDRQRRSKR